MRQISEETLESIRDDVRNEKERAEFEYEDTCMRCGREIVYGHEYIENGLLVRECDGCFCGN